MPLATAGSSLDGVEVLPGHDADLGQLGHHRRVVGVRRVGLHQLGEQLEVGVGIELVDLLAHGGLHVDGRIDLARLGRVGLAPGRQRHGRHLVLQRVHRLVVLGRAGAVDAAQQPDQAGGRLVLGHALGQLAAPARAGDGEGLRAGAGGALARHLEHVGPAVEHRQQEVAALHVGHADDPRLLAHVEPGGGVERVGVGRRDVAELRVRVGACADELAHRPAVALGLLDVGHDAARHLHRHQRVAVDVGLGRQREGLGFLLQRLGFLGRGFGLGLDIGGRLFGRPSDRRRVFLLAAGDSIASEAIAAIHGAVRLFSFIRFPRWLRESGTRRAWFAPGRSEC